MYFCILVARGALLSRKAEVLGKRLKAPRRIVGQTDARTVCHAGRTERSDGGNERDIFP